MAETFHRNNFHKKTFCIFTEIDLGAIANLTLGYKSKSGSSYYFTETGVYRLSNHWGRAANCKWRLQSSHQTGNRTKLGFALWSAFHRDNELEKLYFIERIPDGVHFQHKDNGNYNNQPLRTASETTRRIKQIRQLLDNDSWVKHYPGWDSETLKEKVIDALIQTDKPLLQIRSELT